MKKNIFTIIRFLLLLVVTVSILTGCFFRVKEKVYYSNEENYVSATGTVIHLSYNEKGDRLMIGLSDLSEKFEGSSFFVGGKNLQILLDENALELIHIGDTLSFTAAPRIFGDGYSVPIVALTVKGQEVLNFETGWKNLMQEYR